MYRLQTTFSSDKDRLLDRISHINNDLHQYLDRESAVTRKAVAKPKVSFQELHNQAVTFHECLAQRWQCSCATFHTVGITVQPMALKSKNSKPTGYFDVIFQTEKRRRQLRIQIEAIPHVSTTSPSEPPQLRQPKINIDAATDMRGPIIIKEQQRLASRKAKEKGIGSLAMAPLSISDPLKAAPAQKSILKRVIRRLQKPFKFPDPALLHPC